MIQLAGLTVAMDAAGDPLAGPHFDQNSPVRLSLHSLSTLESSLMPPRALDRKRWQRSKRYGPNTRKTIRSDSLLSA